MEELELIEEGWNYFVVCLAKTIPSSRCSIYRNIASSFGE